MEKIIHQIWVGPYPMPQRECSFLQRMRSMHPDFEHRLWTDVNLPTMPPEIRDKYEARRANRDYAFQADILRVFVVWLMGGVYFDIDMEPMIGFAGLAIERWRGLFHYNSETDHTIPNDTIGLERGHPLAAHLIRSIACGHYDFGPHWLGASTRQYLGIDASAPHDKVRTALGLDGVRYIYSFGDKPMLGHFEKHFTHRALFSWSDENRARFEKGQMP